MAQENENGLKGYTASEAIDADIRVTLNSSQQIAIAGVGDPGIGTMKYAVESGKTGTVKLWNHPGTRRVVCAGAVTIGTRLHCAAAGKFDDAVSGGPAMFLALAAASGSGSKIEAQPLDAGDRGSRMLYNATAQSDAGGTSSASEFTFSNGSYTIPAGELKVGDIYRIRASGRLPATNGADTFTGRFYFGTELVASTPAPDAVNDDVFKIIADVTIRDVAASGKLVAEGDVMNDALAAGLATPFKLAEATEDLTVAVAIAIKGIFSASSAGNEARLDTFSIERIRK